MPTAAIGERLAQLFDHDLRSCPLVVDPLLVAGSGDRLAQDDVHAVYLRRLLPRATVVTPNLGEALRLTGAPDAALAAQALLGGGCGAVLVTDVQPGGSLIVNELHRVGQPVERYEMERFRGDYHGTGCTLASALACGLAEPCPLPVAVTQAQRFAHAAVAQAWRPGSRQHIPRRHSRLRG